MKKILAILLACVMLISFAAPITAMAAKSNFVDSVQQTGDLDEPPHTVPTGDDFPTGIVIGAAVLAVGGIICFAVLGKKNKNEDSKKD